jgi:hypothetical protein
MITNNSVLRQGPTFGTDPATLQTPVSTGQKLMKLIKISHPRSLLARREKRALRVPSAKVRVLDLPNREATIQDRYINRSQRWIIK